jgi:hypothetical protein
MKMLLKRKLMGETTTIGELYVDGTFECFTCEDKVREDGVKVPGATAIPAGEYAVRVTWSNRFGKSLPQLMSVPGFEGIRIHPGNTAADTEGCILPGVSKMPDGSGVTNSRMAFQSLFGWILKAESLQQPITIEVRNGA